MTPPVGPRADVDVDASWRSVYLHGALPAEGPIAPHEEANSSVFQKLSVCELELDAWAEDIANPRLRLSPRPSTGGISAIPSLMALWEVCAQLHAVLAASHECVCVCSRCTQDEHARREAAGVATLLSPVALTAAQGAGREPIDVWRVELACLWLRPPPMLPLDVQILPAEGYGRRLRELFAEVVSADEPDADAAAGTGDAGAGAGAATSEWIAPALTVRSDDSCVRLLLFRCRQLCMSCVACSA